MAERSWTRIQELFDAAADLEPPQRAELLQRECAQAPAVRAEVERLLEVDARLTRGSDPLATSAPAGLLGLGAAKPGDHIAGYEVVGVLGSGGMGTVYEAVQSSPRRNVALKMLHVGPESERARRRFDYEAEVLARLRHPGIAQVFASGVFDDVTTGRALPWFAMEMVEGARSLTDCVRADGLDLEATLRLFAEVCSAVHHGHLRGVVHRDLKPTNILVGEDGRPKVIDFGIARCVDADAELMTRQTADGSLLGTPLYMSPEQLSEADSDVDSRTDIYALGVILYELLCGVPPFDVVGKSITAVARTIVDGERQPPSRRCPELSRELDWIVDRALAVDRERRYGSAAELARDVEAFLAHEPIAAGPPTARYRLRKLGRRHRVAFTAGGLLGVGLIVFSIVATWLWLRALDAEAVASERADRLAEEVQVQAQANRYVRDLLAALARENDLEASRVAGILELAASGAGELYAERPEHEAALRVEIGRTYSALGQDAAARPHLERALALAEASVEPAGETRLVAMEELGVLLGTIGEVQRGETLLRTALAERLATAGDTGRATATARHMLAHLLYTKGEHAEALELAELACRDLAVVHGAESKEVVSAMGVVVLSKHALRAPDTVQVAERAVAVADRHFGRTSARALTARNNLSMVLAETGAAERALPILVEIVEIRSALSGERASGTLDAMNNLGATYFKCGNLAEAERWMRRRLELSGERTPPAVIGWNNLASILWKLERHDEALAAVDKAVAMLDELVQARGFPARHWLHGTNKLVKGRVLTGLQRYAAAEPLLKEALEILTALSPPRVPRTREALFKLYKAWGKTDEAARYRDSDG